MIILFILGLLLGGASVIFALQNVAVVTVTFFAWQLTGSLSLILMLAILTGMLTTLLIVLPEAIKNSLRYRELKKENEKLEEELRKQKELTFFAKNTIPTSEEIARIKEGAIANSSVL